MHQSCAVLDLGRQLNLAMRGALGFGIQAANPLQMLRRDAAAAEDKGIRSRIRLGIAVMRECFDVTGSDILVVVP